MRNAAHDSAALCLVSIGTSYISAYNLVSLVQQGRNEGQKAAKSNHNATSWTAVVDYCT
jgi:hypothetical protein